MKNLRNVIVFALVFVTMMSCQKDQEITTANIDSPTVAAITGSKHTHANGRKCASKTHMTDKLQDVSFRKNYEQRIQSFARGMKNNVAKSRAACSSPTLLPVAIHYQGVNNPNKSCLTEIAKRQIAILNDDFQGTNGDIVQWNNTASAAFPGINNGAACLEFQIATKNHPSGYGLSDGDLAITYNQTNGDQANQWSGYINVFVNDGDGSLGYAPFGGEGNGDGVVVAYGAFGSGSGCGIVTPQAPNDLGRTLTHEIGHYFFLEHVWGDNESCNNDDGVSDTPNQSESSFGCPGLNSVSSCGNKTLHMNYMDYTDDPCMYMFTAGQVVRMENWVNNSGLLNRLKSAASVLGGENGMVDTGGIEEDADVSDNTDTSGDTNTDTGNGTVIIPNDDTDNGGSTDNTSSTSKITLKVTLDDYGSETTFAIEDGNGEVVKSWGPFADNRAGTIITRNITLPTGGYTFVIFDDYGDGICCSEGAGNWKILKDNVQIKSSNGRFGYWEEYDFTVGSARLSGPAHRVDAKDETALAKKQKPSLPIR